MRANRGYSRRAVLQAAALAGAGVLLGRAVRSAVSHAPVFPPLIWKPIPATGEMLPVIGLGTNRFSNAEYDALKVELGRFTEVGAKVIDTAAAYGDSEAVIGQSLADLGTRDQVFLATKLSGGSPTPPNTGGGTASANAPVNGQDSLDRSLQRLRTSHLDLLQVHNLNGVDELMPQLLHWKKAGKIRYIGVSTSNPQDHPRLIKCMQRYRLDFVQVDYSIGNRDAAATVFPVALKRRVGVIANVPLGGRSGANQAASRNRALPPWAADFGAATWAQFMLKYVVSHAAVTCAVPGSTKIEHLLDNQMAGRGFLPDASMRKLMEHYWDS
ncbi:MAG TPA: aldo/keto reductase [Steroidobacteraceae bacterium]